MKSMHWAGRGLLVLVICAAGVVGCKKSGDAVSTKVVAAEVGAVAFPTDVMGFAGIRSMDDLSAAVGGIASVFNPQLGTLVGQQLPELLRTQLLGLGTLSWMDGRKPVRVVVLDFKKYAQPYVIMLPVADAKGLETALPAQRTEGETGLTWTTAAGRPVFMNRLGDFAVFTMAPETFPATRDFLRGDFAGYQVTELIDAQISTVNVQRIMAEDIDALQKQALAQAVDPAGNPVDSLRQLIESQVKMLRDLLAQTEVLRVIPVWNGQDLALRLEAKVTGDQLLSRFAASTRTRKVEAFRHLPEGGWLVVASNVDPTLFAGVTSLGIDFYANFLNLDAEARNALAKQLQEAAALQTGDTAFAILFDGEFPWRVVSITGVSDGAKAREATYATYTMVMSKLGAMIDAALGSQVKEMPKVDWSSFSGMIDSLRPTLAESGITLALGDRQAGNVRIDTLDLTVDYTKVPLGAADPTVQTFSRVMGGKVGGALGFDDRYIYGAFGKDAAADIEAAAKGAAGSGQPLATALEQAKFQVAFAAHVAVAPLIKAAALIRPELADMAAHLDAATRNEGLALTIGAHGDTVLGAQVSLPLRKLAEMLTATAEGAPQQPPTGAPLQAQ